LPNVTPIDPVAFTVFPTMSVRENVQMVLLAHRVVWPDHSIMIDTAMAPAATKKMPGSKADAAAFDRVEAAMKAKFPEIRWSFFEPDVAD